MRFDRFFHLTLQQHLHAASQVDEGNQVSCQVSARVIGPLCREQFAISSFRESSVRQVSDLRHLHAEGQKKQEAKLEQLAQLSHSPWHALGRQA